MSAPSDLRSRLCARLRAAATPPAGRVAFAASGGADSTALVSLLCEAGLSGRGNAVIAHFDHRVRGPAAGDADAAAVRTLAARYGLRLITGAWDAPRSGEAAAREARYAFLRAVAERTGAASVATGHTADDQAETVLMQAWRGAGLHGLGGMRGDAAWPAGGTALRLWRPLLGTTRAETRAYCDAMGLRYVDDATNDDPAILRNRLRLEVLPRLEQASPGILEAVLTLADGAQRAADALDAVAAAAVADDRSGGVALDRRRLAALPREAVPHAFRLALVRLLGNAREFERKHYGILASTLGAATGASFMLPRGVIATVDATQILLSRGWPLVPAVDGGVEHSLPFEGVLGAWSVRAQPAADARLSDGGIDLRLPAGAVLRARRSGDRVPVRAGSKKLADWYIDRKLPRREREAAPVIAYGNQVLWTPWGAVGELPHGVAWRVAWARAGDARG
jgi:tRNA(Ile)-lysidine synthetase-like protein